jgi:hypothetical protein
LRLEPPDDWRTPFTPRQEAADTLAAILHGYVARGGRWFSEPEKRKAMYCWSAIAGLTGDPRDEW